MKKEFLLPIVLALAIVLIFFRSVFIQNLVPIPTDLIVGLFHPFRDLYAKDYPRGVPFHNPLIADPITQQTIWRKESLEQMADGVLPLWNPYQMAGYPLLANVQSAPFYPLNIVFLLLPFLSGWSLIVVSQPFLAFLFMYFYLRSIKRSSEAAILGAVTFSFSGFMISWLEWGTIGSTALWWPLALYGIERLLADKKKFVACFLIFISIVFSFLAGHTQTFFYGAVLFAAYCILRLFDVEKRKRVFLPLLITAGVTTVFLLPFVLIQLQFIFFSARGVDQDWHAVGWFIPFVHAVQFIVPNFFGNPATGNYWGAWNYGEFIGYIGILPLVLALFAIVSIRSRLVYFFTGITLLSLLIVFPTPLSKLIFKFGVPFLSSAQPTRMLFLIDLSFAVLAALGMDTLAKQKRKAVYVLIGISLVYTVIVVTGYMLAKNGIISQINWGVTSRNLILPAGFLTAAIGSVLLFFSLPKKINRYVPSLFIFLTLVDLFMVASKYNTFSKKEYFFPQTKTIDYLQKNAGQQRIMVADRGVLHPNIPTIYKIQAIDGYDPLYLYRFGELFASAGRGRPDIQSPFGYFRILTTEHYQTPIINLLGVKYVLSLRDIESIYLKKVFQEGETRVYQNLNVLPRTFFVKKVESVPDKQKAIEFLYRYDLLENAVVENEDSLRGVYASGSATIVEYKPEKVSIKTENDDKGFLMLTDTFYPTWKATIDGTPAVIHRSDFNFRGLVVPPGEHAVVFSNTFFSL